jgi:nitrogen-specific signal transduction histidine kinase
MFSQELFHSFRNELMVVLRRAELLAASAADQATLEYTRQIKAAALKIRQLIQPVQQDHA